MLVVIQAIKTTADNYLMSFIEYVYAMQECSWLKQTLNI